MIDFNFEPQPIDFLKYIKSIKDNADTLENFSLTSHEDIEREIKNEEKNIQSLGKEILTSNEDIFSEIKNIFSNDFENKISLFKQLVSINLTEEIFPIKEWIKVADSLDYIISYNDIQTIESAIESQNNQEIKETLIYNFNNIIKELLNSKQSLKYNNGNNIIKNYISFMKKIGKNDTEIDDSLKSRVYENKEFKLKNSNANFWKIYLIMNDIESNKEQIKEKIKDFDINQFFSFIMDTDLFVNYSYKSNGKRSLSSIKINKLRDLIMLMDDEKLQKDFFPHFLEKLKNFEKNQYLSKENQETFSFLLLELEKGLHCLTLTSKLNTNKIETKEKKVKI